MSNFLLAALFCLGAAFASAQTWTINADGTGDFPDIQSAITAANPGDIIQLEDGFYHGTGNCNISFLGKSLTVKSIDGPEACVIDGAATTFLPNRGFIFESGETRQAVLEGITIRNFAYLTCCDGGAGILIADGSPTIRNCRILNCRVEVDMCPCLIYGGGISVVQGSPLITGCQIIGNTCPGKGGGIACSSDMSAGNALTFLENCIIAQNSASSGGGVYLFDFLDAYIKNCTIAYNQDYGIWCEFFQITPSPTQIRECLIWQNAPGDVWAYSLITSLNYTSTGGPVPLPDPKFVDVIGNDYHLQWNSPCIDFCQSAAYDPNDVDVDGEPRVIGPYADAGADEVGPKQADFSRNGRIDMEDFETLARAWQSTPTDTDWYLLCDLHPDDVIDVTDLQLLAEDWLWQASWYTNP